MLTLTYERRAAVVQARGSDPLVRHAAFIKARITGDHSSAKLRTYAPSFKRLEFLAQSARLKLVGSCKSRVTDLCVESGVVSETVALMNGAPLSRKRNYLLAIWRGAVVHLGGAPEKVASMSDPPTIEINSIDRSLPVVFGPSAVLTLVEELGGVLPQESPLRVSKDQDSPYPPFGSLLDNVGCETRFLLSTPECWTSPISALPVRSGSYRVDGEKPRSRPAIALVLDTLVMLANGPGPVEFEAKIHVERDGRSVGVGSRPIVFRAEVRPLANALRTLVGSAQIGIVDDPIAGWRFGYAPPMLSRLSAAEFFERTA